MKLEKSEIIPVFNKFKFKQKFEKMDTLVSPDLPKLEGLNSFEKVQINVKKVIEMTKKSSNFTIKSVGLMYQLIKLRITMEDSLTTKLSNRAFWLQIIGWVIALLGLLGVNTGVLNGLAETIATAIASIIAIIIGLFYQKKTGKATKDSD